MGTSVFGSILSSQTLSKADASALMGHLKHEHTEKDRLAQASTMIDSSLDAASCEIIFPVCSRRSNTAGDAFSHLLSAHLFVEVHFQAWMTAANNHRVIPSEPIITKHFMTNMYSKGLYDGSKFTCLNARNLPGGVLCGVIVLVVLIPSTQLIVLPFPTTQPWKSPRQSWSRIAELYSACFRSSGFIRYTMI